jgi:hypothetical protein
MMPWRKSRIAVNDVLLATALVAIAAGLLTAQLGVVA